MKTDLTDTTASKINKALVKARREIGTPAVGMVLTLVIVTDEENAYDALKSANDASREHPSRTIVVIKRVSRSPRDRTKSRLDAEVRVGADAGTGDTVVLRLYGEVADHAQSVVLPLLLPDAPVVVWWPVNAPLDPARDPLGALGQRRVTDSYAAEKPIEELRARADNYEPGDTDLAWTRITPWRSMLAAALDQVDCEVISAEVQGEQYNPSVELLAMWLADRLHVHVRRGVSSGPGLNEVRMLTSTGPIRLYRPNGGLALLTLEGQPDRAVALKRRETSELLAEELRRLDPDDTYASALRFGVDRLGGAFGSTSGSAPTAPTAAATTAPPAAGGASASGASSVPGSGASSVPGSGPGSVSGSGPGLGSAVASAAAAARASAASSAPALPPAAPSGPVASPSSAGSTGAAGEDDSERPTPAQMPPVKKATP
ncbi:glucose-6-phosphate dehydrogenase assembly protein OpcA [Streptomyces scabiei]|uniref:glucose-6-phosphate dehydrogenase assembly protein OpcA n=1 Tax=Streptomyces scabiei TaxID=1930 RepID=UPI001B3222C4|nr:MULTISPECIES: glucose-6-phosphate dehydrogenase assembly protein OpcA [Streptomyces]MBP5894438.1 glucose-6-phosphate dehydrogenase assembly protein OpcA [Streptomyces sp. LBUM 1481]MBP5924704.1 glucose-6-phosphate dehydrogenase assembly protein OpcA [Streptomyces sp. LBUM 1483]MDX2686172.1 glucose-6-phosphate dehydrogenase assembly protein OpcA [Streptomyces scabiei]MDX2751060.1 glucose-6-phosphate dehydrogenase assembly protein OpcA [Streptomyces scabiei]MDX2805243.1 glucose-6-phosphate de